jgi:hypothetical protein
MGKEFVFAFQKNHETTPNALLIFITGQKDTTGKVEIPGLSFSKSFTVKANNITTVEVPKKARFLSDNAVSNLGIIVTAKDEITVYGLNQVKYSTDAFLALPSDTLGTEYIAMSYPSVLEGSQIAVVGVFDNTKVTMIPSIDTSKSSKDVPFQIKLNRGEVFSLNVSSRLDLTGTQIKASAPIAVMSGSFCAEVPPGKSACDHLVEMMAPLSTWGTSFLTKPLATRKKGEYFRILASQNSTKVKINNKLVATLNQGEFFEDILTAASQIESSAAVLVAQYSPGTDFDGVTSDPFMMLIPPTEQFLKQYTFSTPATIFQINFVNVIAPTSIIPSLILDGVSVDQSLFTPIGTTDFSGAQIPVSIGSHNLKGDSFFGIYAYGFANADSYGYPGGMAFELINKQGDRYPPNVRLSQDEVSFKGTATDSEDINANSSLDSGEDINNNGAIDKRTEDLDGNEKLDYGEDVNNDEILDQDTGILKIELGSDSKNLQLDVAPFTPGDLAVDFQITLIDPLEQGKGTLIVSDVTGNKIKKDIPAFGGSFITFNDQLINLKLGKTGSHSEILGQLDLSTATVKGKPVVKVTTDYEVSGTVLEIDLGNGWVELDDQSLTMTDTGNNTWPVRVRTGRCPDGVSLADKFIIFIEGMNADGLAVNKSIDFSVEVIEPPWLQCWWPVLAAALGILMIGILIHGFVSPFRFSPRLGVVLSPEDDIAEGFFHPIRARRGFYRDARAYICADFRIAGKSKGAIARLRASGKKACILPVGGNALYRQTIDGEWEKVPSEETVVRAHILYKDSLGTLFFEIKNG